MKYITVTCILFAAILAGCCSGPERVHITSPDERGEASEKIRVDFRIKMLELITGFKKPVNEMTQDEIDRLNSEKFSPLVSRFVFGKFFKLSEETFTGLQFFIFIEFTQFLIEFFFIMFQLSWRYHYHFHEQITFIHTVNMW